MRRNFAVTTGPTAEEARPAKRARRALPRGSQLSALQPPDRYTPRPTDTAVITAIETPRITFADRDWTDLLRQAAEKGQDINDRRLVFSCPFYPWLPWEVTTLAPEDHALLSLLDFFLLNERNGVFSEDRIARNLPAEVQVGHAALSLLEKREDSGYLPTDVAKIVVGYLPAPAYYQPLPKGTLMSLPGKYRGAIYDMLSDRHCFNDWRGWYKRTERKRQELASDLTIIQATTRRQWLEPNFPGIDSAQDIVYLGTEEVTDREVFRLYRRYERLFWSSVEECLNNRMKRVFLHLRAKLEDTL